MGSGAGQGFSIYPDWSTYCLFAIWQTPEAAAAFFDQSELYRACAQRSSHQLTLELEPFQAKGEWDGIMPFPDFATPPAADERIAVLTRAAIRPSQLVDFWRHVPATSRAIAAAEGLLFSKGVGEWPLIRQATLSIWENKAAMRRFAYEHQEHREVIKRTYARRWYSEELFAEFRPLAVRGEWPDLKI
jgi:heme-degrading monooxygenase HmoA